MTLIVVSSILLISLGGGERAFAQSAIATMTIAQPNLPTITFTNNTTVDIPLNADGSGIFEFQSLINDGTITITNQGSNSLRFEFDRDDNAFASINPDNNGLPAIATFQIASFTETHTVVYNRTHLAFNLDNSDFRGTTPSLPLQASLHELGADIYDSNPSVHVVVGNTNFRFIDPPLCETTLGAVDLDFGTVNVGDTTPVDGGTVVVENTGAVSADVNIGASHWCEGPCFTGLTSFPIQMLNSQTSFSKDAGTLYAAKTAFTVHGYGVDNGAIIRGNTASPFVTPPLFTIAADAEDTVYLQTNVVLDIKPSTAINTFEGDLEQEIIIESECG